MKSAAKRADKTREQRLAAELERRHKLRALLIRREARPRELELARRNFRDFARLFWPVAVPTVPVPVWGWYIDAICDEIQALFVEADRRRALAQTIRATSPTPEEADARIEQELGGLPRLKLVIMVGPRMSKSSIVGRLLPAWRWASRPQEQFLALAGIDMVVVRDGIHLRALVGSKEYRELLVHVGGHRWDLRPDQNAKDKFDTTLGGTRQGYTIASRFTGADSDVTIIDDPCDVDEVLKGPPDAIGRRMAEVVDTYRDKIQDRANEPLWHITILIMQRLHVEDLAAYMIRHGARTVCLPSEYDPDHEHRYEHDRRTESGEPLSPQRLPKSLLAAARAESEWIYEAKHQQRPTLKSGGMFRRSLWRRFTGSPRTVVGQAVEVVQSWDVADKIGATNAYSVCHTVGKFRTPEGLRYRVLDEWRGRVELPELEAAFDLQLQKWPQVSTVYIEDAANGRALGQRVRRMGYRAAVVMVNPRGDKDYPGGDKETRAQFTLTALEAGMWELPEDRQALDAEGNSWAAALIEEHAAFPMATIKDRVDALSQVSIRWQSGPSSTLTDVNRRLGALLGNL